MFESLNARLDHIGIAVRDLAAATAIFERLGLAKTEPETVEEQDIEVIMLPTGDARIELLRSISEDSPVAKFIEKRGEGIHHIALAVPDIRAVLKRCRDSGMTLIDAEPRLGAGGCLIAFLHPTSTGGVLIELIQRSS